MIPTIICGTGGIGAGLIVIGVELGNTRIWAVGVALITLSTWAMLGSVDL